MVRKIEKSGQEAKAHRHGYVTGMVRANITLAICDNRSMALPRTLPDIIQLPHVRYVDRGHLPGCSGIYFVVLQDRLPRLAYVGKAKSFLARWTGHHRAPDLDLLTTLGIEVSIHWCECDAEGLPNDEEAMISLFRPPLNERSTSRTRQPRLRQQPAPGLATQDEILRDFRSRRDPVVSALRGDELWDTCNDHDGDLLTVWAYPRRTELIPFDEIWMCSDTHSLAPCRIPLPPAFRANETGVVVPNLEYRATSAERRSWLMEVAYQVDAWLTGVVEYHAAIVSPEMRRDVLVAMSRERTVSALYDQNPEGC